jgi:Ca-activated chloride channel homolog
MRAAGGAMQQHTNRSLASFVIAAVVVVVMIVATGAQSNLGSIHGVVTDTSSAALPGVGVTLRQSGARDLKTLTNEKGEFSFLGIGPGQYELTCELAGFTTRTINVDVGAGATVKLTVDLSVGRLEETLTVSAATPRVDAHSPGTGGRRGHGQFNTEAYDRISDNQWHEVAHRPLSTFSADVDTASYSNVRRFLNNGEAPPKDAVRIEELINYFQYDYPEPRNGKPIAVTTAIGECPWNPQHRLALIGLQARKIDAASIPPRNLVFLIDVSGSMMDANKLPLVKASLAMLAPNLTASDRIAIVVYAGNTGLVLPSTSGSDTTAILEALKRLEAGGSTNGGAGLALAYRVARDNFIKGGVNRVLLATDGDFNVGVTDQGSLVRMIEEERESGVALSVLGYGMGNLKDATMVKLADAGNGNYAYIDSLSEANKVLVEQAGGTLVTVAKDVKLQIEFNPRAVSAYRLIGYEKRILQDEDFNNDSKDAGDMGAGHSVTALYEFIPAGAAVDVPSVDRLKYQRVRPARTAGGEAMTVKIRYKEPEGRHSALIEVPVENRIAESDALGFASAVAEFGMVLRDSEHKGSASLTHAVERARAFKGDDPFGHRAEFVRLAGAAEGVSRLKTAERR